MSAIAIAGGSGGRTLLTANVVYHVATTGSDSNPGTLAQPWATLRHAMVFIAGSLDIAGFEVDVSIGAGIFVGFALLTTVGGGQIMFFGAGSANTTIRGGYNDGVLNSGECISGYNHCTSVFFIKRVTLKPDGGVPINSAFDNFASVFLNFYDVVHSSDNDVTIDTTNMAPGDVALWIDAPGSFIIDNGITVTGNGNFTNILLVESVAVYLFVTGTGNWTIAGNITVSAFAQADTGGVIATVSNVPVAVTGSVTGQRFLLTTGSMFVNELGTGTSGPSFFPGTVAGTCDASSIYDGFPGPFPGINTQTANYILALSDAFNIVEMNLAGANTVTVPANATIAFEIGTRIQVTQIGAGATTIQGAVGVTVDNAGALSAQWGSAMLYKRGTNEWVQTIA